MGEIVYVVTSGSYSDYGINGVYSTLELAEAAAGPHERGVYNDSRVEWYLLDEEDDAYGPWTVSMHKDGQGARADRVNDPWDLGRIYPRNESCVITVMAETLEQAVKAANEKRAFLIASGTWDGPMGYNGVIELTKDMFKGAR